MSRRSASLNFTMTHSLKTLEFSGYVGHLAGARQWEDYVDTQDDKNGVGAFAVDYFIRIQALNVENDEYRLITQGHHVGGRRFRYGTLDEMIAVAEKWAARRFKIEQKEVNA